MLTNLALSLLLVAVFLYALFFVVRAAVEEGIRRAVDPAHLSPRSTGGVSRIPD